MKSLLGVVTNHSLRNLKYHLARKGEYLAHGLVLIVSLCKERTTLDCGRSPQCGPVSVGAAHVLWFGRNRVGAGNVSLSKVEGIGGEWHPMTLESGLTTAPRLADAVEDTENFS